MNIIYYVLGIEFSVAASVIEDRIMEMGADEFIAYARGFIANYAHPACSYYSDRDCFKSREEWQEYEIEGGGHRLIRIERGFKLYWEGNRLNCLFERSGGPFSAGIPVKFLGKFSQPPTPGDVER